MLGGNHLDPRSVRDDDGRIVMENLVSEDASILLLFVGVRFFIEGDGILDNRVKLPCQLKGSPRVST